MFCLQFCSEIFGKISVKKAFTRAIQHNRAHMKQIKFDRVIE